MLTAMLVAALVGAGLYLLLILGLALAQRALIYLPDPTIAEPAECGLPEMVPVPLRAVDGMLVTGWYAPPPRPDRPCIVMFHGNAGTIAGRAVKARRLLEAGCGLFLAEYRGYGGNPGRPTERGLLVDAAAVLDWLHGQGVRGGRLVLYGESLGSGIAATMAARLAPLALILECPFTALPDLAPAYVLPGLARMLIVDRFDTRAAIAGVTAPLLILHGERDQIVPVSHAHALLGAAPGPHKEAVLLPNAGHNDLWDHGAGERIVDFLDRLAPNA